MMIKFDRCRSMPRAQIASCAKYYGEPSESTAGAATQHHLGCGLQQSMGGVSSGAVCDRAAGRTLALSRARGTAVAPAALIISSAPAPETKTTHTRATTTSNLETCMLLFQLVFHGYFSGWPSADGACCLAFIEDGTEASLSLVRCD
jgi:hypothetical protein